jgi:cysteine-rich repeat protein
MEPGEECDDGNLDSGDGCSGLCYVEILCGNLTVDYGEECDDGNRDRGDGCDPRCLLECGNGRLDPGEECDPEILPDTCTQGCQLTSGGLGDGDPDTGAPSDEPSVDTEDPEGLPGEPDEPSDPSAPLPSGVIDIPPSGSATTVAGELSAASATWTRPVDDACSGDAWCDDFPYEGYVLHNGLGAPATVSITVLAAGADEGTLGDGRLFAYAGSDLPADTLDCVAGDDDGAEGFDPMLASVEIGDGASLFVVVTSFYATPESGFGTYALEITTD